jgi:pimeloyl-ACP methyl ester carboxylesterase
MSQCAPLGFDERPIVCGAITLNVAMIGEGPPVVFLHGFPEHWRAFSQMMKALSWRYHCIAPDQRGFGQSPRPRDQNDYRIDFLADDIANMITALGYERVDIVAHNWGGLVAWHFGSRHRDLVRKMVIFNAPHPYCLQLALDTDPVQRAASSYAAQFALANSHKAFEAKADSETWDAIFGRDFAEGFLSQDDKAIQIAQWKQDGAWEAMLNWYRAAGFDYSGNPSQRRQPPNPVISPTLLVWGTDDALFAPSTLLGLGEIAPNCEIREIEGAGHCVFRERPGFCAQLVEGFLSKCC